jgi:hypothetical protein
MSDAPRYLTFTIALDSRRAHVLMHPGGTLEGLYNAWRESGLDEDFEELCEWVHSDVAEEIDFYIEDVN